MRKPKGRKHGDRAVNETTRKTGKKIEKELKRKGEASFSHLVTKLRTEADTVAQALRGLAQSGQVAYRTKGHQIFVFLLRGYEGSQLCLGDSLQLI